MRKSALNSYHSAKILSSIPTKPKVLTAVILQALAIQAAQAGTIEVTSHLDDGTGCTLREAITASNTNLLVIGGGCSSSGSLGSDDEIVFAPSVSGSTITLTGGQLSISESVSINVGGSDTTIAGSGSRLIGATSGATVSLDHLILTGGNDTDGGAIRLVPFMMGGPGGTLILSNSTITGNMASDDGGGIHAYNSSVSLINTTISGNTANQFGGGLYAYSSIVNITNSTVSGNSASSGSGLFADQSSTVNLTNSTMSDNTAGNNGGLYAQFSTIMLTNSTVSGNTANDGGGLHALYTPVTLTNSTVSGNSANQFGGGLYAYSSSLTLTNSTVSGNSAGGWGGGLLVYKASNLNLINSTVSGNSANNFGGGLLAVTSSTVTLTNSTVSDNTAPMGSGVALYRNAYTSQSTLTLANSVVANGAGGGQDCEFTGTNPSGHSITMGPDNIVETNSCGGTPQTIDPGLTPLTDNGGATETHALVPGSPAIDGGTNIGCPTTDQRGEARDDGACDIGAYEFIATVIPIAKKDRKMGVFMSGGEQWYSFNSTESQKLSMQTNGYNGDTLLEFYQGINLLSMDDGSGPDLFSNIKHNVTSGPHLIRVKGKTDVDPYWLRLMSDEDILSFGDTASHFANKEIRVMSSADITGGCGVNQYCPTDPVTRAQMAIFMLKAILGGNHSSPAATGTVFNDVSTSSFGANFIEEFSTLGITSGCGGGKYCPDLAVTREQMAVFLLRAWYGSSYSPPTATPAEINQFSDIANSFARDWIVQLTKENITGGCGGGKYCPTDTVTRGQMAAFIARTFDLDVEL